MFCELCSGDSSEKLDGSKMTYSTNQRGLIMSFDLRSSKQHTHYKESEETSPYAFSVDIMYQ